MRHDIDLPTAREHRRAERRAPIRVPTGTPRLRRGEDAQGNQTERRTDDLDLKLEVFTYFIFKRYNIQKFSLKIRLPLSPRGQRLDSLSRNFQF